MTGAVYRDPRAASAFTETVPMRETGRPEDLGGVVSFLGVPGRGLPDRHGDPRRRRLHQDRAHAVGREEEQHPNDKFMLVNRRKEGMTPERFRYEWGVVHVAVTLTTPSAMEIFRRYVQGYSLDDVDSSALAYPLAPQQWEGFASLSFETLEDVARSMRSDYLVARAAARFQRSGDGTEAHQRRRDLR